MVNKAARRFENAGYRWGCIPNFWDTGVKLLSG